MVWRFAGIAGRPAGLIFALVLITPVAQAADEVSYLLVDLPSGKPLLAQAPDRLGIPASVTKAVTAYAALEVLGADYRFTTRLLVNGTLKNGVLTGDLILAGQGDPLLDSEALAALVQQARQAGLTSVSGRFLYDASWLAERPAIDPDQPDSAQYNTGVSALSVNFNRIEVNWQPVSKQNPAPQFDILSISAKARLPVPNIEIIPASQPSAERFDLIKANPGRDRWQVQTAKLPAKGQAYLPVHQPAATTAHLLRSIAQTAGLTLPAPQAGITPANAREIARHASPGLPVILSGMLHYSNNLTAELVGLATARHLLNRPQPQGEAATSIATWLARRLPDSDWRGYSVTGQSGLSAHARTSPRHLVAMLVDAERRPPGGLPLGRLMKDMTPKTLPPTSPIAEIRAKTGTMSYARGLAGYLETKSGQRRAFAILIGDPAQRHVFDATMEQRDREIPGDARAWLDKARKLEQELLKRFGDV